MDENLKKMISDWAFRVGREGSPPTLLEDPSLPDWVLKSITDIESFRRQAIEDAKFYWTLPLPFGFGMELFFPDKVEINAFQSWRETIHNLTTQMQYCERMDGTWYDRYEVKIERVGREAGVWRIIEVFSKTERAQTQKMFQAIKEFYANKDEEK